MISTSNLLALMALLLVASCSPSPSGNPYSSDEEYSDNGGNDYEDDSNNDNNDTWVGGTKSIAYLKSLYAGSNAKLIESFTIEGVVTANDIRGEFIDAIVVEDSSGAIEIAIDNDSTASDYMIGTTVAIICNNLYLGSRYGTLVLGCEPEDDEVVGALGSSEYGWRIIDQNVMVRPSATLCTIAELTSSMTSCYIQLKSLSVISDEQYYCTLNSETGRRESTIHTLEDEQGNEISLYVPSTVDYNSVSLPANRFNIYAILEGSGSYYSLRIIDHGVVELD